MKTIEDAARECAYETSECYDEPNINQAKECFKEGVEFAQRWIPVNEELPIVKSNGFSDLVITKNKYNNYKLERYDFESKCFNELRYGDEVTHWRQIDLK